MPPDSPVYVRLPGRFGGSTTASPQVRTGCHPADCHRARLPAVDRRQPSLSELGKIKHGDISTGSCQPLDRRTIHHPALWLGPRPPVAGGLAAVLAVQRIWM